MNLSHRSDQNRHSSMSTVIVVMAILAPLLMFSTANLIPLIAILAELVLLDERQQLGIQQAPHPPPPATR